MKKFTEKKLEDIIFNSELHELEHRGLSINGKLMRQVKIGNYGIVDLISFSRGWKYYRDGILCDREFPEITIYELKKDIINNNAFFQAVRYLKGIKQYLKEREISFEINFKIVLIGFEIDLNDDLIYLNDILSDEFICRKGKCSLSLELYKYDYSIKGIEFEQISDYCLTNQGF
jgi:hypothetical protein